jgi:hypothetical protein
MMSLRIYCPRPAASSGARRPAIVHVAWIDSCIPSEARTRFRLIHCDELEVFSCPAVFSWMGGFRYLVIAISMPESVHGWHENNCRAMSLQVLLLECSVVRLRGFTLLRPLVRPLAMPGHWSTPRIHTTDRPSNTEHGEVTYCKSESKSAYLVVGGGVGDGQQWFGCSQGSSS